MRLITARLRQPVGLLLEGGACSRRQEAEAEPPPREQQVCGKMVLHKQEVEYLQLTANLPANADLNRNVTTVSERREA